MDLIDALDLTFQHTGQVISGVRADQLDDSSPCTEWTVRDLLAHTIAVVAGMGASAAGTPPAEFQLGTDPTAQFREAAAGALLAWRAPGALDRIIDGGPGPMPGRVLAGINLLDTATHCWDIAIATGQAATLPDEVATAAMDASRSIISPEIRPGRFGPELSAPADADPTQQLVAFLGRQL